MALSRDDVHNVALLARLELSDDEIDAQAGHINGLLREVEKLQELDVTGIEPTSHSMPVVNVFREDATRPSLARQDALANAPQQRDGYFVVPRIMEG